MRRNLLLLIIWVFAVWSTQAQSQYKIAFSYDNAGNQILRDRVCVNCQSAAKTVVDSTKIVEAEKTKEGPVKALISDDSTKNVGDSNIIAHPNPVTDILKVEWVTNTKNVSKIVLFSSGNSQLLSINVKPNQSNLDINFSLYPIGVYVVLVAYSDGSKKSFQVIKK